jgi:hypothetical protein
MTERCARNRGLVLGGCGIVLEPIVRKRGRHAEDGESGLSLRGLDEGIRIGCRSDAERRRPSLVENREKRRNRKVLVSSPDEVLAGPSSKLLVARGRGSMLRGVIAGCARQRTAMLRGGTNPGTAWCCCRRESANVLAARGCCSMFSPSTHVASMSERRTTLERRRRWRDIQVTYTERLGRSDHCCCRSRSCT